MTTLVLGAGVSGLGAARLLRRLDRPFEVYDEHAAGILEGAPIASGPWDPAYLIGIDRVITSPGFPETSRPIHDALAEGIEVRSELDLAASFIEADLVAVTGTNGKTTTTELVDAMARHGGMASAAAGNIGTALSDLAATGTNLDVVAVEASSFQLRFAASLHPRVAVVLAVTADHLDWHGSAAAYRSAKARIVEHQEADDVVVYDADDPGATEIAEGAPARRVPISATAAPDDGHGRRGDSLVIGELAVPVGELAVTDAAYLTDLAAAGAAALAIGVDQTAIEATIRSFRPGAHRRRLVTVHGGVAWVDDSKATNPHAAGAAIAAYDAVVLIAGGRNKGLDLSPLVEAPNVRAVLAIGEASSELGSLAPHLVEEVGDLTAAVRRAAAIARPGDTVLLAPGCASFDQYPSYAARGDAFAAAVADVTQEETA